MSHQALAREDELHSRTGAERASERVLHPFYQFARWQASGAVLLLACAVGALVWANSPWALSYEQMLHARRFVVHQSLGCGGQGHAAEELRNPSASQRGDIHALARQLQREGAQSFIRSWQRLLQRIEDKSGALAGR